jgi:hypothetical protein
MKALLADTIPPAGTTLLSARAPFSGRYGLDYIRSRTTREVIHASTSIVEQRQGTGCCSPIIYQYVVPLGYNVGGSENHESNSTHE